MNLSLCACIYADRMNLNVYISKHSGIDVNSEGAVSYKCGSTETPNRGLK